MHISILVCRIAYYPVCIFVSSPESMDTFRVAFSDVYDGISSVGTSAMLSLLVEGCSSVALGMPVILVHTASRYNV